MRLPGLVFVTVITTGGAPAARVPTADNLPFEVVERNAIAIPVTIDDAGPFRFLLDTGASHSSISARLADRLDLRPVAKTLVTTPAGDSWRVVVALRRVAIGNVAAERVLASVAPTEQLVDSNIHGVLGQDVLAELHFTLDYRERLLWWGEPHPAHGKTRVALEWVAGCPVLRAATAGADGSALRLIPDTGASHLVLFQSAAAALPRVRAAPELFTLRTLADRRTVQQVVVAELRVGDIALTNQPAALIDSTPQRIPADGLLPLHLFRRVTFNGPGRYLLIEPR